MNRLCIPKPVSAGIILSYKCTSACKHCMYACSPHWEADWLSEEDAEKIFAQLSDKIHGSPYGKNDIGINFGIHFTGGEPFLNFELLLKMTQMANRYEIPSAFVETNCFWCTDDETTRKKLMQLRTSGLNGILISVNPFILEEIPFEKTARAVRLSEEIFSDSVIVYQEFFYRLFKEFNIKDTMSLKECRRRMTDCLDYAELLPMGRASYALGHLYEMYPAEKFFGISCRAELTRDWHVHIDNYGNYMPGYCGGITLGDARELDALLKGIDLGERPILRALVTDLQKLYEIGVERFDFKERTGGYVSKCHLCTDVRKRIVEHTDEFKELRPAAFYKNLMP